MFYEAFGLLLDEASEVLNGSVRRHVTDERVRTQLDAVATLLADLAAMWNGLFQALEAETEILEATARADPLPVRPPSDPLARQRAAIAAVNDRLRAVADAGRETESVEALRTALLAAADVQRALVEEAVRQPASSGMRRI